MAVSATAPNRSADLNTASVLQNILGTSVLYPTGIALTNSTPAHVAIVDGNGDQVTSFGGGTQYTNGGTPPANPVGPTLEFNNAGVWATVGSANPLPIVGTITANTPQSVVSTNNSSVATLTSGSVFTGTADDCLNYSEIRVTVIANVASATDGLSIQQSSDSTNWDITDVYTVAANTGKTFVVPRQARYMRVVYTNGGTGQASFRLQAILNKTGTSASSQRPSDAYTNETDLNQHQSFLMGYNGTTWDRLRSTIANGLSVDVTRLPALVASSAVIGHVIVDSGTITAVTAITNALPSGSNLMGKVGLDQTTPGTTNAISLAQINAATTLAGNGATGTGAQRVTIANDNTGIANWGQGATGSAVPSGAQYGGSIGKSANPTAVSDGNLVGQLADLKGRQIVQLGHVRELRGKQTTTIAASTSETTIVTAAASTFNDLVAVIISNTSALATRVDIRDTTGGTVLFSLYLPAGDTRGFSLPGSSIPQTSVNTNWTAQSSVSITDLRIFAIFEKNT